MVELEIYKLLAALNRRSENVRIFAVIVSELEFRDVQRHVFGAHLVECTHHAALEDRPEAFNGLGMDSTDHILSFSVVDNGMGIFLVELVVTNPLIGAEQADLVRDRFADESGECIGTE